MRLPIKPGISEFNGNERVHCNPTKMYQRTRARGAEDKTIAGKIRRHFLPIIAGTFLFTGKMYYKILHSVNHS